MSKISITSEIGKLEKVVIHTPGVECENMSPSTAAEVLYNDILPLNIIQSNHKELEATLKQVTNVYQLTDLIKEVLKDDNRKKEFIDEIFIFFKDKTFLKKKMIDMNSNELVDNIIHGFEKDPNFLENIISNKRYDLPPLPNLYFMRDSAIVVRNRVIIGSMATNVRIVEALFTKYIYKYHPEFKTEGFWIEGTIDDNLDGLTIEGGDVHIIKEDCLAIGISERTTPKAIDLICERISKQIDGDFTIFAQELPKGKGMIHLDMTFTMVDKDRCVIYEPYILGKNKLRTFKISINKNGSKKIEEISNLIEGLKTVGINVKPILCGGENPIFQEREQWLSGTNFFTFAPGKFLGYDCNSRTMEEIKKAGYEIIYGHEIVAGKKNVNDYDKCAVLIFGSELARGGGGCRCMTMPVKRANVNW